MQIEGKESRGGYTNMGQNRFKTKNVIREKEVHYILRGLT